MGARHRKRQVALASLASLLSRPEDIRRVCRKCGMKVVFRSGRSLRSMLTKVKDALSMEKMSKVVYQVPCSCGKAHVGETVRRL